VAEDEEFTLNLLREILTDAHFEVVGVRSVSEAIKTIENFDPHAVVTDLNFGINSPSGADLLIFLHEERPWIGKVILTSHASPNFALPRGTELPPNVIYLVKSELQSILALGNAIRSGLIIRPEYCSKCGSTGKIEGHHEDYSNPLDVMWLCRYHHVQRHNDIRNGNNY
jgi:DNA-binding NarL/FixJ family response regulator